MPTGRVVVVNYPSWLGKNFVTRLKAIRWSVDPSTGETLTRSVKYTEAVSKKILPLGAFLVDKA